jgi:hypothetical protein
MKLTVGKFYKVLFDRPEKMGSHTSGQVVIFQYIGNQEASLDKMFAIVVGTTNRVNLYYLLDGGYLAYEECDSLEFQSKHMANETNLIP